MFDYLAVTFYSITVLELQGAIRSFLILNNFKDLPERCHAEDE